LPCSINGDLLLVSFLHLFLNSFPFFPM
jgi:hypothetical protein